MIKGGLYNIMGIFSKIFNKNQIQNYDFENMNFTCNKNHIPEGLRDNPKFNRTNEESKKVLEFSLNYSKEIDKYEEYMVKNNVKIYKTKDIDLKIKYCKETISTFNTFKNFCTQKGLGGQIYFSNYWGHCHNSKNTDFVFISKILKLLKYLEANYDSEKNKILAIENLQYELLKIISDNPGILQKDIYNFFDTYLKSEVQSKLYDMDSHKKIYREKYGNTYKLYLERK